VNDGDVDVPAVVVLLGFELLAASPGPVPTALTVAPGCPFSNIGPR
jgi:hypothetical protein